LTQQFEVAAKQIQVVRHRIKNNGDSKISTTGGRQNKKAALIFQSGLLILIPATTYVPTQLPVQYHRPGEA
jgi:hypothetical protein